MGQLTYASDEGHSTISWQPDDEASVTAAKQTYDDLKKSGYDFYLLNPDGSQGEPLQRWSKKHQKIIAVPGVRTKEDKKAGKRERALSGGPRDQVVGRFGTW